MTVQTSGDYLTRLRKVLALARTPIVGIPIILDSGELFCIRVRRDLLEAGAVHAKQVYWDAESERLVLNGDRRSCYRLVSMTQFDAYGRIAPWARAQRIRVIRKTATKGERKAAEIDKEIGILRRKADKIRFTRPVNPICQKPQRCEYGRDTELAWTRGKDTRKELSRVFTSPALKDYSFTHRPDWKIIYTTAANVLGIESISDRDKHSRITKLTNGPTLKTYITRPDKYLARMNKPWARGHEVKYGEDTKPIEERMREWRKEYLEQVSLKRAIECQIENLTEIKRAILESEKIAA
jgi:hypothetical protein